MAAVGRAERLQLARARSLPQRLFGSAVQNRRSAGVERVSIHKFATTASKNALRWEVQSLRCSSERCSPEPIRHSASEKSCVPRLWSDTASEAGTARPLRAVLPRQSSCIVENDVERKAFTGLDGTHAMAVVG